MAESVWVVKQDSPIRSLQDFKGKKIGFTQGLPYWSSGQIHLEGIKRILEVQKMVGALSGDFDLSSLVDTSLLPDDIKAIK